MPRYDDDDGRPRRSWREIDRKKDGSAHIDQSDPYKKSKRGARVDGRSKSYRSALDTFFDGGSVPERFEKLQETKGKLKGGKGSKRQKALRDLKDAVGTSDVKITLASYLKVDPELPRDMDALMNVLQHPDEGLVQRAISLLDEIISERSLPRKELLKQRLRRVEDLAEETDTAEMASELRRKLG